MSSSPFFVKKDSNFVAGFFSLPRSLSSEATSARLLLAVAANAGSVLLADREQETRKSPDKAPISTNNIDFIFRDPPKRTRLSFQLPLLSAYSDKKQDCQ